MWPFGPSKSEIERSQRHEEVIASLKATREAREKRNDLFGKMLERELSSPNYNAESMMVAANSGKSGKIAEGQASSYQSLGNPWWTDMGGLFLDDAWRRGFPSTYADLAYWGGDEATIANDDTLRTQILKVCRALYAQHPHARGIVNGAVSFVCGSTAWQVVPMPKIYNPSSNQIHTVTEDWNAEKHPRGAGGQFSTKPEGGDEDQGQQNIIPIPFNLRYSSAPDGVEPVDGRIPPVRPDIPVFPLNRGIPPQEDKDPIDIAFQNLLRREFRKYMKRGVFHPNLSWLMFWVELSKRFFRDGEVFVYLGHSKDNGRLTPRFLEPEDICCPSGNPTSTRYSFDPNANGIAVNPDDPQEILGYYWRPHDRPFGEPIYLPANQVLFLNHSTDSTVKRGLPLIFTARHMLRHFDTWIQQSLKHQRIQSSIAILRQWEKGDQSTIAAFAQGKLWRERSVTTPAGQNFSFKTADQLPIIDAPAGMSMTGFTPHGNFMDSEILARRVLLAACSAVGQSEAMVTADGSNANYSSTRITQFIPLQQFKTMQALISETVEDFYKAWISTESLLGRLPKIRDESQMECRIIPAKIPNFEAEIVAGVSSALASTGVISKRTMREMCDLDPDTEEERVDEEKKKELDTQRNAEKQVMDMQLTGQIENPDEKTQGEEKDKKDEKEEKET